MADTSNRGLPQMSLKERIAALQQQSEAPTPKSHTPPAASPPGKATTPGGSVRGRVANFEVKGSSPSPVGAARSPSAHGRRRSVYGGEQDDAGSPSLTPLVPSMTGGSFISPMPTGGSFKDPIVRNTDFQAVLGRARRAERRQSSSAPSKTLPDSSEPVSRATSPPSSFPLGESRSSGFVAEPEPIVAHDMSETPSTFSTTEKDTATDVPQPSTATNAAASPPVSSRPSIERSASKPSVSSFSSSNGRMQSVDTVKETKDVVKGVTPQTTAEKPIVAQPPSSPPRKSASIKLARRSIHQAVEPPVTIRPSVENTKTQGQSSGLPATASQDAPAVEGLPISGFDLAGLLQNANMLEESLADGKVPTEQPAPAAAAEPAAPQKTSPQIAVQPPAESPKATPRETAGEARPRPQSTLLNVFRKSSRNSAVVDEADAPNVASDGASSKKARPESSFHPEPASSSSATSPSKSPGKYFSSLRRLTNSSRSAKSSTTASQRSLASLELSSDDSHPVVTPSDASEFGYRASGAEGSSSFLKPQKSSTSLSKTASFTDKLFGRSRTKSNNSTHAPSRTSTAAAPLPQIPQETFDYKLHVPGIPSSPITPVAAEHTKTAPPPALKYSGTDAPKLGPIYHLSSEPSSPMSGGASSPLFDFDSFPAPPTPSTIRQSDNERSKETKV